jgi:hypothetical protein
MNKTLEILLTALALVGMYSAIPKSVVPSDSGTRVEQTVILADGTDPMPLCRARSCNPRQ